MVRSSEVVRSRSRRTLIELSFSISTLFSISCICSLFWTCTFSKIEALVLRRHLLANEVARSSARARFSAGESAVNPLPHFESVEVRIMRPRRSSLDCMASFSAFSFSRSRSRSGLLTLTTWVPDFASSSCCWSSRICSRNFRSIDLSSIVSLTTGLFLTFFARVAKRRVEMDSSPCWKCGVMLQITAVREFPPSEGCSSLVRLESLKGTWPPLPSERREMTCARVSSEVLMFAASLSPMPVTLDSPTRSEPARSTRLSTETRTAAAAFSADEPKLGEDSMIIRKIVCERDERSLSAVADVCLRSIPFLINAFTSSGAITGSSTQPWT
eukprot:comp21826_c0_seq1/m.49189 comp21826_c0_seq1/g.49189  ORF comp21826_c0_seq1/g.49189 comp21826_c0_seq1/m.49189 type:complete len:328 (-) comp21826_c0_seq1:586-1569(-)